MNTYSPNGLFRMQQRDVANIHSTHPYLDGSSLAALERQRGWRADAEAGALLKQHGVQSAPAVAVFTGLRRSIGAAFVRAGQCLATASPRSVSPGTSPVTGLRGTTA